MTRSYMEYAMSVIMGRAMPDVRDGLKPVHRRILYAMNELGLSPEASFRKSARVVGEVLGKYHPHGDTAVYDALVRMAQAFSMSIPLVNGHGNFGSTDGDPPAAMRYTECKLAPAAKRAFLQDLDKDTVAFNDNFDGSETEPMVLPVRIPNLLVNGSSGIAVGMATNIPPHNLSELVAALKALIANPQLSDEELFELVPAPDFPTGAQILGTDGAREMYTTGRGRVVMRACAHSEFLDADRRRQREAIIVTELPYQVNKASLVEKIASLVNEKKIEGVADLRDESDRNGTRIVIEIKRDAAVPIVLNNLYKKTQLQVSFAGNVMALDNGRFPIRLTLRSCLMKFLDFRRETVTRRLQYDLRKTEARLHILAGLLVVQNHIDEAIQLIRQSNDTASARQALIDQYNLSEVQANAVLEMQLRRLTSLEYGRLGKEKGELEKFAAECRAVLADQTKLDAIIADELDECDAKYATPRRSTILRGGQLEDADISELSLMTNERSIITVTTQGYIKRMAASAFSTQNRGTRGKRGVGRLRAGDKIAHLFSCMSHDALIAISSSGIAYEIGAHKVPMAGLTSRGVPIFQLLPTVPAGETIAAVIAVTEHDENLVLLTQQGYIKKMRIADVRTNYSRGKKVISLDPSDELKWVRRCSDADSVLIGSKSGKVIRFSADEKTLRGSGRSSRGVKSMKLAKGDEIADMDVMYANTEDEYLFTLTDSGRGKRVLSSTFSNQGRAGVGVRGIGIDAKDGTKVVAWQTCKEGDSVMIITADGTIVRMSVDLIPIQGRNAKGVRIQRLDESDTVAAVAIVDGIDPEEEEEEL